MNSLQSNISFTPANGHAGFVPSPWVTRSQMVLPKPPFGQVFQRHRGRDRAQTGNTGEFNHGKFAKERPQPLRLAAMSARQAPKQTSAMPATWGSVLPRTSTVKSENRRLKRQQHRIAHCGFALRRTRIDQGEQDVKKRQHADQREIADAADRDLTSAIAAPTPRW